MVLYCHVMQREQQFKKKSRTGWFYVSRRKHGVRLYNPWLVFDVGCRELGRNGGQDGLSIFQSVFITIGIFSCPFALQQTACSKTSVAIPRVLHNHWKLLSLVTVAHCLKRPKSADLSSGSKNYFTMYNVIFVCNSRTCTV